ncbi:glycosyltransferase family 2 protein [Brachyspira sp.]|uniref:glycosyltransferase family 2 protein n=1 Tax=Brachyspira sp. TaxID=1977261 RepID=UPI00260D0981|nr:glycosyltransferase family 2 protein [Brachyspira sp.]
MPFFSIIVPVYNTEKYLKRCLDSLISQTFKDIEIIVVNDCSTDNSGEIIKSYIKNDDRLIYIEHEINKGTLISRKNGSIKANGKYITYVDSDDELDINTCKEVFECIKNNDYDIIYFGVKIISNRNSKDMQWSLLTNRYNIHTDYLMNEAIDKKIPHNMCGKFFNKEIINKIVENTKDIKLIYSEDMLQCLIGLYYAKSIFILHNNLYIYNTDISISTKNNDEINLEKYEYICQNVKSALNEFYNFLIKLNANISYGYEYTRLYYNQYMYLFEKIENNEQRYLNIINKYFDEEIINQYLKLKNYYNIEKDNIEKLNNKLKPYFFSIIIKDFDITVRLFGIRIIIKNKKCIDEPIVITLSNILRNIFSINTDDRKNKYIKILFIKIKLNL